MIRPLVNKLVIGSVVLPVLLACTHLSMFRVLRRRTRHLIDAELLRMKVLLRSRDGRSTPTSTKLHFASGNRVVPQWLNADLNIGRDPTVQSVDLSSGNLPWPDHVFDVAVGQMVIDDLEMDEELIPLLKELHRTLKPGAVLWVSCPDIEKICRSYLENRCTDLIRDRQTRWPDMPKSDKPTSQFVNDIFYEKGNNMNLFDFDLLKWCLEQAGFHNVEHRNERALLSEVMGFPPRNDDTHALYVRSVA
jgi:predicted SAM-dependent methyltransferase